MALRQLFCQPAETTLFKGVLLNNYDSLRENRHGQEPPRIAVRESPTGEITIRVKVQSESGAIATIVQRVLPGFTLLVHPSDHETIQVVGLSRTIITLPPQIIISNGRRSILEKKHKNYRFATRAEAQEFAHSLLCMTITASIEIQHMNLFEYNPTTRQLAQTHSEQRLAGGADTMFLHLLRTHKGRHKILLARHKPKTHDGREENFSALVYVNRATSLILDQEPNSFSSRFTGIRIHHQLRSIGFKRDGAGTESNNYDSGGGDVVELTFWCAEDRKKLETFVKRGKGTLGTGSVIPAKMEMGIMLAVPQAYELPGSTPSSIRITSQALLSSTSLDSDGDLADARTISQGVM